jgi:hypothetical protein
MGPFSISTTRWALYDFLPSERLCYPLSLFAFQSSVYMCIVQSNYTELPS